MQVTRDETIDITEMAPGGDGVGHFDHASERRAVFVPSAVAGDRLDVRVDMAKRPARGTILAIAKPSEDRRASPCAFADECGACDWMVLTPSAQRRWHEHQLRNALPRAFREIAITIHAAPAEVGWRTRARVHIKSNGRIVVIGMNARRSHEPVDVSECIVLREPIERARRELHAILASSRGRGEASIQMGKTLPVIDFHWTGDLEPAVFGRFDRAVGKVLDGVRIFSGEVTRPATIGDPTPWTTGADELPLELAPGGFAQANDSINHVLARRVADFAVDRTLELFAGSGNFSILCAKTVDLTTVESDEPACNAAKRNLVARGLAARVVCGDASTFAIDRKVRTVILDPPRRGARATSSAIAASRTTRVVYVSCDVRTLARDLEILCPTFRPTTVESFEMFPCTSHFESLVVLDR